jgi:hypothetical protein
MCKKDNPETRSESGPPPLETTELTHFMPGTYAG